MKRRMIPIFRVVVFNVIVEILHSNLVILSFCSKGKLEGGCYE